MRSKVKNILLIICCIVSVSTLFFLYDYYREADGEQKTIAEIKEEVFIQEDNPTPEQNGKPDSEVPFIYDYAKLKEKNSDCIGWLTISGTKIDYPVMWKSEDNEYYLHRNFYGKESRSGTLFVDASCVPDDKNLNLIIYGHHMKDGSMFADLLKYTSKEFWQTHREVSLYIRKKKVTFDIFAVCKISADKNQDFYNLIQFENKETYQKYMEKLKEHSIFDTGMFPEKKERLLLLSTCEYSVENGRLIVLAKEKKNEIY